MFRSTTKVTGLLTAVLLAVSCSESSGPQPERGYPDAPLFSFSASGITLSRDILTMGQSGRLLIKGFNDNNNANPHHGDAIIATFYWVGSTYIIDSVVDVQTTSPAYTPVGNTYNLVEYVTAGGISMATYVATNIQNFPDPNDPSTGVVLAVGAYLSESVTDGGIRLSSWTGVEDVFAQALGSGVGAPRSASGSGTVPTVASAGPIELNPGAVVYGVTLAKPPVGTDRDPAYTSISGSGSDQVLKEEAVYAVRPDGGTANPQWTWYFDQQPDGGTWLATVLTLNASTEAPSNLPPLAAFTSSCSLLTCNFTSTSSDPDGSIAAYSWDFGDGTTSAEGNPSHTYATGGTYQVTLTVADNLGATNATLQSVTVNRPPTVNAGPDETALTGLLYRLDATFGDPDNDGPWSYTIDWGDGSTTTGSVSSQGTISAGHTYVILLPRNFTIRVTVTDSHGASGSDTKVVRVLLL